MDIPDFVRLVVTGRPAGTPACQNGNLSNWQTVSRVTVSTRTPLRSVTERRKDHPPQMSARDTRERTPAEIARDRDAHIRKAMDSFLREWRPRRPTDRRARERGKERRA